MMLTAVYKFNGQIKVMVQDYPTKQAFIKDLKGNDFTVIRVSTNADLVAQEYGFENIGQVKKKIKFFKEMDANSTSDIWKGDIEKHEAILKEAMEQM